MIRGSHLEVFPVHPTIACLFLNLLIFPAEYTCTSYRPYILLRHSVALQRSESYLRGASWSLESFEFRIIRVVSSEFSSQRSSWSPALHECEDQRPIYTLSVVDWIRKRVVAPNRKIVWPLESTLVSRTTTRVGQSY